MEKKSRSGSRGICRNDEGDETKGRCYESLVTKILSMPDAPAVLLLFAVFANDWNLQERLARWESGISSRW